MKIIDGSGMVLGRLASYAAKESLKGEDIYYVYVRYVGMGASWTGWLSFYDENFNKFVAITSDENRIN